MLQTLASDLGHGGKTIRLSPKNCKDQESCNGDEHSFLKRGWTPRQQRCCLARLVYRIFESLRNIQRNLLLSRRPSEKCPMHNIVLRPTNARIAQLVNAVAYHAALPLSSAEVSSNPKR